MEELEKVLKKYNFNYETVKNLYSDLLDIYLKTKDQKIKNIANTLSSAMFEFKKYYIENN